MPFDPALHHRRSIRLRAYDYAEAGAYFVTVCVQGRKCLFGTVRDSTVALTPSGRIVVDTWNALPGRYPTVDLNAFVVMPNHMHGILVLTEPNAIPKEAEGGETPPLQAPGIASAKQAEGGETPPLPAIERPRAATQRKRPTLGQIVAFFKYQSTRAINTLTGTPGVRVWQRNYYEHVIRDETSLDNLRTYVVENPLRWELDTLHPDSPSTW